MSQYCKIEESEMVSFLWEKGFSPVELPNCRELVLGKVVRKGDYPVCLRVYTSIVRGEGRDVGEDAIRVVVVTKHDKAGVIPFGRSRRVYRVQGWRNNLQNRIETWESNLGPICPRCGAWMALRKGKNGPFWGCTMFKSQQCKGSMPVEENQE
jgi:hypothetical protein